MCKFNKEEFFKVNPNYLVAGYIIIEINPYYNKLKQETKHYKKLLLMNKGKALELVVDTRNYYVKKVNGEKVVVSKEVQKARKQARDKAYNHKYYLKVTKGKREEKKQEKVREAICKICGKPFTFISKPIQGGANRKICSACKALLNKKHYYTRKCKRCGATFTTTNKWKVYCSASCRSAYNTKLYLQKVKSKKVELC